MALLGSPSVHVNREVILPPFLSWGMLHWLLLRHHLLDKDEVLVMGGDEVVVTKAGKKTHGLDRCFSSLDGKVVPGLCFLRLSLISVKRRTSYPMLMEQIIKPDTAEAQ